MSIEHVEPGSLEFQVEFIHPATMLSLTDADEVDNLLSEVFYGASTEQVVHIRTTLAETTRDAAAELAASPEIRQAVEHHFSPGQTIAAVGDSLTDDIRSWAYILAELLAMVFPEEPPVVLNFGKSGDTTVHVIEKMNSVLAADPDWIIFLVGSNDAKSFSFAPQTALVEPSQTARNVAILDGAARRSHAKVVWMIPPLADDDLIAASPYWADLKMSFTNERVQATRDAIARSITGLDLESAFQRSPRTETLLADGLHPNPIGQKLIAAELLANL